MLIKLWSYLYSGSLALWLPTATRGKTWLIWYCSLVDNSYKITDTVYTHKASTSITKLWPFIRGLVEVMCVAEVEAQLSTYRHSPHEVRGYFFTADLSLPGQKKRNTKVSKWVEVFFYKTIQEFSCCFMFSRPWQREGAGACSFLTCQFRECRRRRGSWLLFSQSPPEKCNHPGSGRNFSLWTAGGNRAIRYSVALVKEQLVSSALVCQVIRKWKTRGCCRVTYSHPPSVWRV